MGDWGHGPEISSRGSCRIARIVRRKHWFSRQRRGVFVALVPDTHRERAIARSAPFVVFGASAEDISAFQVLLNQLIEEGWERWHEPDVPLGIDRSNHGYWSWTLQRRCMVLGGVDEQLGRWRARSAAEHEMEMLREHAIERLRREGYQI